MCVLYDFSIQKMHFFPFKIYFSFPIDIMNTFIIFFENSISNTNNFNKLINNIKLVDINKSKVWNKYILPAIYFL